MLAIIDKSLILIVGPDNEWGERKVIIKMEPNQHTIIPIINETKEESKERHKRIGYFCFSKLLLIIIVDYYNSTSLIVHFDIFTFYFCDQCFG